MAETEDHTHELACETGGCHIPVGEAPESIPEEELLYDLADLFKVFSDTTRIKILFTLMGRELCVADIADETGTTQSAVSLELHEVGLSHICE